MTIHHPLAAAFATAFAEPAVSADTLTSGRLWSLVAVALGLAGVVIGAWALARPAEGVGGKRPIVALAAGLAATVIGVVVVAAAEGGPGTGYGIVGGYIALVVGLAASLVGGLALARSRRSA